jgi:DNA-binding response OmpR family regulator
MRLLLVEDDPRITSFVAKGLREEAYAVDLADNGDDALYKASINDYDAIVLDIMIPARDGFEVCRELRATGSAVPVIMLTARDSVEDRIRGLDSGADDYLTKPFEVTELLARLRALRRRGRQMHPSTISVGDLVIDTRAQIVARGGRVVSLTAKEFAVLEFLARNAGRVLGRAEIAEHVWDENFDPLSNLIDVYVNRLRRKVDDNSSFPLIHTRRGSGYVLRVPDEAIPSASNAAENSTGYAAGDALKTSREDH